MRTLYYKIISIAIVLAGLTACDSISIDDVVKSVPVIESYTPAQASIGDEIIVTGSSLNDVTAATIGGETVEILQKVSDNRLSLRVTANAKTGKIELTNATGKGSSEGEVVIMTVTPTISTASFKRMMVGDVVTLRGNNLEAIEQITVGGTPCDIIWQTTEELRFTVPAITSLADGVNKLPLCISYQGGQQLTLTEDFEVYVPAIYTWRDHTIYGQSRQAAALSSFFSPETGKSYLNSQWRTEVDPIAYKYQAATCSDRNKPAVSESEYNSVAPYFYLGGMSGGTLQVCAPSSSPTMLKNFYTENNSADKYRITGANADCYGTPAIVFLWLNPEDADHKKLIDEVHAGTLVSIDEETFPIDVEKKTCRGFSISNMQRTVSNTVWANGVFETGQPKVADVDAMLLVVYYNVNGEETSNRSKNIKRLGILHIKHVDFRMNGTTVNPSASGITFDMYWQKHDYDYVKVK